MLQMLSEVICAEKLLSLVAFAKLMHMIKVLCSGVPIRRVGILFTAESTHVGRS